MRNNACDAIVWLASSENADEELREQAKDVLDTLAYFEYCRRIGQGAPIAPHKLICEE